VFFFGRFSTGARCLESLSRSLIPIVSRQGRRMADPA